jgi:hypothetical protein
VINVKGEVFVKLSSCLVVKFENVMNIMSINHPTILKKGFVFLGIFLLVLSVAAIAVLGCLLAAIGYHDG